MAQVASAVSAAHKGSSNSLDPARVRPDFPILSRVFRHGTQEVPLIYLDNAATTQKPRAVLEAMVGYYEHSNANVHRSLHTLGEEATAAYEGARRTVKVFLGASSTAEVVFTRGATESINLVASSWGRANLRPGDHILLTDMEHHSNIVPWQLVAAERGAVLDYAPLDPRGALDWGRLEVLVGERTRIVALNLVSNVLGTVNDVSRVSRLAHRHGAVVLVDAAQAAPHMSLDVADLRCDFLALSAHKMYGPMGVGVLWGREPLLETMPPYMGGGEMIRRVELDHSTWNDLPHKFEAGTPYVSGAVGLAAAIEYLGSLGMEAIRTHEQALTARALRMLSDVPGLTLHGTAPERVGVFAFSLGSLHPHDVAQYLDSRGIAVRAGHHCAQPLVRKLGVTATVRASLGLYNTSEEIDALALGLRDSIRYFDHGPG